LLLSSSEGSQFSDIYSQLRLVGYYILIEFIIGKGTQICYCLFEELYKAKDAKQLATVLLSMADKQSQECFLKIRGNLSLLTTEPFFGTCFDHQPFAQPPFHSIHTTTFNPVKDVKHPTVVNELADLIEEFLQSVDVHIRANFWQWVYQDKFREMVLSSRSGYDEVVAIAGLLKKRNLITTRQNGSGIPFVLASLGVGQAFRVFVSSKP